VRALLVLALVACKDKQDAKPAAPPAPTPLSRPAASLDAAVSPAAPTAAPARDSPLGEPLTIEEATKVIPTLTGKQILPLRQTTDHRQVHATWCLDGASADAVARDVGRQLADEGFTNVVTRGDARKAGVQGTRGGFELSMIVAASSASTCPAPQHYFANATVFRAL
jgi:hypothetical protein